jgi:alkaline phosphatase
MVVLFSACQTTLTPPGPVETGGDGPARVILVIADGAGAGHWAALRMVGDRAAVEDFAATGLVDTRGADHVLTGSAASATAYAIGKRTYFGAQGVGPDSVPSPTVLEVAEGRGMSTGMITTTIMSDATPAAFASHTTRRTALGAGRQFATSGVDILMGGGRELFTMVANDQAPPIIESFRNTHTYVTSERELDALDLAKTERLLGLFADRDMDQAPNRSPALDRMVEVALDILGRNPAGFFLLVENEETDTRAHRNEPFAVIAREMQALDDAIRVAVTYQRRHPETLIVVTGDHETGGLSVIQDSTGAPMTIYNTTGHTAELVPIFANGPGAEAFGRMMNNERVGQLLLEHVGRESP